MNESGKDNRPEPTVEQQEEFDALYKDVLRACDEIVFGRPYSAARFAEIMGGQENVDKYYKMKSELKVKIKSGAELGIKTRLNG